MNKEDFIKLKKLMMMTTSDHDNEALNALRMANALLKKDKKNWEETLDRVAVEKVVEKTVYKEAPREEKMNRRSGYQDDMHMFYDMHFHRQTEKAIFVSIDGDKTEAVWLPKSQVKFVRKGDNLVDVNIPEWLAVDKGLA